MIVFKRFGYSTVFKAEYDLFADNLLQTQKPQVQHDKDKGIIDTSCCEWSCRVRLPVPDGSRVPMLDKNAIAETLSQHVYSS